MIKTQNKTTIVFIALSLVLSLQPALAQPGDNIFDDGDSVGEEQIKEKEALRKMRSEMDAINSEIKGGLEELQQVNQQFQNRANKAQVTEVHLFARNGSWETRKGDSVHCLSYNGRLPGPVIRAKKGDNLKIVLHNQLDQPTSLYFHGLPVPHEVNGLPRKDAGLVPAGGTFAYQFTATKEGTFWYHPQVVHADQRLELQQDRHGQDED